MGGPTGTGLTAAPPSAAAPALALIDPLAPALALADARGAIVRHTEAFRAAVTPSSSGQLSLWDWLEPDQRARVGRVHEGRLLHAEIELSSPSGPVPVEVEAVLDPAGTRLALLTVTDSTVAGSSHPPEPRSGATVLLADASIQDSRAIVWIKDLAGRYLRINRRYTERLGIDETHILGHADAELRPSEVVGEPQSLGTGAEPSRPTQLEYTVASASGRESLTVLRFPLHGSGGEPVAVCGVAATVAEAAVARSEAERLLRLERWAGLGTAAIRAELIAEWELTELAPDPTPVLASVDAERVEGELAGLRAELQAARAATRERAAELDQERSARADLEAQLHARTGELERLREAAGEVKSLREAALEVRGERARAFELEAALETQLRRADAAEREVGALRRAADAGDQTATALAQAHATVAELQATLESERTARVGLEKRLREEATGSAELREAAAAAAQRAEEVMHGTTRERARASELEAAVETQLRRAEAAERESAVLRARAEVAERDSAAFRARAEAAERESAMLRAGSEAAEQDSATHRARAEAAEREGTVLHAHVEAAEQESAALRAHTEAVEQQSATLQARAEAAEQDSATHRARAEAAESALAQARREEDEHGAVAERARTEASAARQAAQEAIARLERERREWAARAAQASPAAAQVSQPASEPTPATPFPAPRLTVASTPDPTPASASGPHWSPLAQRTLTSALASATEWRVGLKDALRVIGGEGGWTAAIAWFPDERASALRCAAMWTAAPDRLGQFETATWQRRRSPAASPLGRAASAEHATWIGSFDTVDEPHLVAAAAVGMRGALLVPVRRGREAIGSLELLTDGARAPGADLVLALEAIGLQLAHFEYLLRQGAEPRWRLGRL